MITGEAVQKCHHFIACGGIDNLVDSCEGKIILGATFDQICEVSTHSPFSILLSDHHYICQPLWVGYFPDEACIEQSLNLNLRSFYLFLGYFLKLLLFGLHIWVDLQLVLDDISADSHKVGG
jgi:hypothetical protein